MAFNPSPSVAAARDFAAKFQKHQVIILSINKAQGTMQMDTYGTTKAFCDQAKDLGDVAWDALQRHWGELP